MNYVVILDPDQLECCLMQAECKIRFEDLVGNLRSAKLPTLDFTDEDELPKIETKRKWMLYRTGSLRDYISDREFFKGQVLLKRV